MQSKELSPSRKPYRSPSSSRHAITCLAGDRKYSASYNDMMVEKNSMRLFTVVVSQIFRYSVTVVDKNSIGKYTK